MIVTNEDEEFDAIHAQQARVGGRIFKYGDNYWERLNNNENIFYVLVPHRLGRSSLPPHRTFKGFEDHYGPINE